MRTGGIDLIKKEQVTIHEIKKDLVQCINHDLIGVLVGCPLLWFVLKISNIVITNLFSVGALFFDVLSSLLIVCTILSLVCILVMHTEIKKEKFLLRNDTLLGKQECESGVTKWHAYKPYRLTFSCGHFDIPAQTHYKWSTSYSMDEKGIYITASIGDAFTLVEFKRKILVAYNNNFFDVVSTKL